MDRLGPRRAYTLSRVSEVPIDELRTAVEKLHGRAASFVVRHVVREKFRGAVAWEGEVHEFALDDGRPVFAWSYVEDERTKRRRYVAVLGGGKIAGPVDAVRAAAVAQARREGS